MTTVTDPEFVERDPETIEREVFEAWESFGGPALEPAQPESLFLRTLAYRETLTRVAIQEAAKLNLLRYSRFPIVDFLGELFQTPRLDAQAATTTLRFTLEVASGSDTFVPQGTRRLTKDKKVAFATDFDVTIPAGELSADVSATATVAGPQGNGYLAGQVATELDPIDADDCQNITTTANGAAAESDETYIERLLDAPDGPSTAGSEAGYRHHARKASAAVADVAVLQPSPGDIQIVVLATDGVPGQPLLDLVEGALTPEEVRPLSDTVSVVAATPVSWSIEVELTLYSDADETSVQSAAQEALQAYADARKDKLGRSATLTQITREASVEGVYDLDIIAPAADQVPADSEYLDIDTVTVTVVGSVAESSDD